MGREYLRDPYAFLTNASDVRPNESWTSDSSWYPRHHRPSGHVVRDDRTRTDQCAFADADPAEHHRARADRRLALDHRPQQRPVLLRLERTRHRRCARCLVVHEHHSVADKDLILDGDAVTDERVALDLAASTDDRAALNLDKRADPGLVAYRAAVEVREREGP